MTSPKHGNTGGKMLKSLFGIYLDFIHNFIAFKNMHVFKIFIFDFKNVHPILDFLTRRGKFISYFSNFYLFFYAIFLRNLFKKKYAPAPAGPSPTDGPPVAPLLSPHDATPPKSEHATGAAAASVAPSPSRPHPPP